MMEVLRTSSRGLLVTAVDHDITVDISTAGLTTAEEDDCMTAIIAGINLTSRIDFSAVRDGDK